ncbi:hypothetical protein LCGC14_0691810 [marine sediment metagenome]|uniref:Phage major capsid protein n=1 Tax=marine sediment metagenome TaxID=412755 RepID=A0A0F9R5L5_9ZZZZ
MEQQFRLVGAEDLLARGVTNLAQLRPILAANADPLQVHNATLRKDEWEQIDERVNQVMRERLTVADDLRAKGLVTPVGLGTTLRVTERLEDFEDADVSYDGDTAPTKDRPSFLRDTIPVPVVSKDFSVSWRQLEASRTRGEPLDTTAAGLATRKVRDKLQDLIVNGFGHGPDGSTIPGLANAANRQQVSLTIDWDASGATIIADVLRMLEAAYAVSLFGPFTLYVPKNYWATLQDDYSTDKGEKTFIQRILAFEDIEAVRPLDTLADDNVIMVQMTEDVIDLSEAQSITTVQWEKNPFVTMFRVLMVGGPHIKSIENEAGTTIHGIIHLS